MEKSQDLRKKIISSHKKVKKKKIYIYNCPSLECFNAAAVKHGGGRALVLVCRNAGRSVSCIFIDAIRNSQMFCEILKEKMTR